MITAFITGQNRVVTRIAALDNVSELLFYLARHCSRCSLLRHRANEMTKMTKMTATSITVTGCLVYANMLLAHSNSKHTALYLQQQQ